MINDFKHRQVNACGAVAGVEFIDQNGGGPGGSGPKVPINGTLCRSLAKVPLLFLARCCT
jgi:hypothetical protein